jgi:Ni,Fe-hydrogenase I cytochrome b subunit
MAFFDDADQERQPEVLTALGNTPNMMVGYCVLLHDAFNLNFEFNFGFLFLFHLLLRETSIYFFRCCDKSMRDNFFFVSSKHDLLCSALR